MKYLVMLGDGMADYPCSSLENRTPLEVANTPNMDRLAQNGTCGLVKTVPDGMVPESDTANLAVMGYDPRVYSKGRSPLEATSMGLAMTPSQTAFRCNLVTLTDNGEPYEEKTILDHSAGEISTEEARELIQAVEQALGCEERHFYTGISYRHCMLWDNAPGSQISERIYDFVRPHDVLGEPIAGHLPRGPVGDRYRELMEKSFPVLSQHPVNLRRVAQGLAPANSVWFWSPGKKPALESFTQRYGVKGTVVCAVDLIKGIGLCAGLQAPQVPGATGGAVTDYAAKARAAVEAFDSGSDFVYIHVEAPDECGHQGSLEHKIAAIEAIDSQILGPVTQHLQQTYGEYRVLLLPDHPTPICKRTHTPEAVPFVLFDSRKSVPGVSAYCERCAAQTNLYLPDGCGLMPLLFERSEVQ